MKIENIITTGTGAVVGTCTAKVVGDIAMKMLPRRVSVPVKLAYRAGCIGLGLIADAQVVKVITNAFEDQGTKKLKKELEDDDNYVEFVEGEEA